jgi:hypothetical protein
VITVEVFDAVADAFPIGKGAQGGTEAVLPH